MKFLVDNQLPAALARYLSFRGVECKHVIDAGLSDASDFKIWEFANRNDYVVISKDGDFLYLANAPGAKGQFIWIRFGNCRTKPLLTRIWSLWAKVESALNEGDRIIELR